MKHLTALERSQLETVLAQEIGWDWLMDYQKVNARRSARLMLARLDEVGTHASTLRRAVVKLLEAE